ncbi:hypothetical protein [Janibacter terrae]|uniref:hypothetical protein n=1 Tax=Janibacter terrae TaxID=103817 RepID=UPI0031F7B847
MRRVTALGAAAVALLAGCGSPAPTWEPVALPGPGRVVTLTGTPEGVLVGRYDEDDTERTSIHLLRPDGTTRAVGMQTRWEWAGREAELLTVASGEGGTVAVGGHRAGAHGNVRWTIWSGDTRRVVEQPQRFETFGGWDAGGLVGAAVGPRGPVVLGSWVSASKHGSDVAVWTRSGDRWSQPRDAGADLRASDARQPSPGAVTAVPGGYLAVGWVTELEPAIRDVAVLWTASAPAGPWREVRFPEDDAGVERPTAVSCAVDHCAAAGRRDDDVVVWRVPLGEGLPTRVAPPELVAADVLTSQSPTIAVVAGSVDTVAHSDGGTTHVAQLHEDASAANLPGRLVGLAAQPDGRVVVATTDEGAGSRGWRSPPSPRAWAQEDSDGASIYVR